MPCRPGLSANIQPEKIRLSCLLLVDLVDLGEGVGLRRLGRRARIADPRSDLQRAELHGLVDRHLERGGSAGDLVEPVEHGGRVADLVGESRSRRGEPRDDERARAEEPPASAREARPARIATPRAKFSCCMRTALCRPSGGGNKAALRARGSRPRSRRSMAWRGPGRSVEPSGRIAAGVPVGLPMCGNSHGCGL